MDFITDNWELIGLIVGGFITVFIAVAKKTTNTVDDKVAEGLQTGWGFIQKLKGTTKK